MEYFIIVDAQKDNTKKFPDVVSNIISELGRRKEGGLIFVCDTHLEKEYGLTIEGKNKKPHCILGTEGWELDSAFSNIDTSKFFKPSVYPYSSEGKVFKQTYGAIDLMNLLFHLDDCGHPVTKITLAGFYTNADVLSNAILLRTGFPNIDISIYEKGTIGTCLSAHIDALNVMESHNIYIE